MPPEVLQEDSWTALGRHAARQPDDPWLFYPEPPDWRWIPLADGLDQVERVGASLGAEASGQGHRGAVVAFRYLHEVSRFVADLAVRASGWIAAPVSGKTLEGVTLSELEARGVAFWLGSASPLDGPPAGFDVPTLGLEPAGPGTVRAGDHDAGVVVEEQMQPSGAQVRDRAGSVHTFPAVGLELAAARLAEGLPPAPRGGGGRHVVLHWRSLEDPGERLLMTWAVRTGAAIVLVPESLGVLYALRWCRPTLLQGTAVELSRLASEVRAEMGGPSRRKLRRHFRRLSAVVALDESADASAVGRWQELGAEVAGLPEVLGGGGGSGAGLSSEGELPDNIVW